MNGLIFEYRDPIYGLIALFAFIFIVSFLTYSYGIYKEKRSREEYRKLLKRFEIGKLKEEDYVHLYTTYNLPFDSIILLASSFLHKGEYNKAISVYLALLECVTDRVKKEELLELLGTTYFKGGFLQRSKDIFLKILKFSPRNKTALKYLLLVYEKLNELDRVNEVLDSLEELNSDIQKDRVYIQALEIIYNSTLSFEKKADELLKLLEKNSIINRIVVQFLLVNQKDLFWENLEKFNLKECLDILWYMPPNNVNLERVKTHQFLKEVFSAKGLIEESSNSSIFELAILINIKHNKDIKANLNFEFICDKCKSVHPIYDNRCPHCHNILTFKVEPKLARSFFEENQSLQ